MKILAEVEKEYFTKSWVTENLTGYQYSICQTEVKNVVFINMVKFIFQQDSNTA